MSKVVYVRVSTAEQNDARQREGIAIAKREGTYKGAMTAPDLPRHYERYQRREASKAALARELGISRPTLDRLFSVYDNDSIRVEYHL